MSDATRVGNYNILLRVNESQSTQGGKTPQGLGSAVMAQLEKAYNVFQISQLGEKACKFTAALVGNSKSLKERAAIFQNGATMAGVAFTPVAIRNAKNALLGLKEAWSEVSLLPGYLGRKFVIALRETANAICVAGYSIAPFLKTEEKTAEIAGDVFAVAKQAKLVTDSCKTYRKYSRCLDIEKVISNSRKVR